jgi:hypothetical protein
MRPSRASLGPCNKDVIRSAGGGWRGGVRVRIAHAVSRERSRARLILGAHGAEQSSMERNHRSPAYFRQPVSNTHDPPSSSSSSPTSSIHLPLQRSNAPTLRHDSLARLCPSSTGREPPYFFYFFIFSPYLAPSLYLSRWGPRCKADGRCVRVAGARVLRLPLLID